MSRISRKKITELELGIKNSGGFFDLFDNHFKSVFRITDDEYDYLCDFATEEEISLLTKENLTFSEKRKVIELWNKYLPLKKFDINPNMEYVIVKTKDNKFNGNHPNHINEGQIRYGSIYLLEQGKSAFIGSLQTSIVKEFNIDNKGIITIETLNSIYTLTPQIH